MKEKMYINIFYIIFNFFVIPIEYQTIVMLLYIIFSFSLGFFKYINKFKNNELISIKRIDLILVTFMILSYLLVLITTKYSIKYITLIMCSLMIILYDYNIEKEKALYKISFLKKNLSIMMISIIVQLIICKNEIFVMITSWDKNFTGVILFLFFMYCNKVKYNLGILISLLISIKVNSRGYILMICLFYIIKIFRNYIYKLMVNFRVKKIKNIFIFIFIFTFIFSYFWVYVVSVNGVQEYQAGINDSSNKMRFVANIKTYELLMNDRNLLINGYDNDIKRILGVDSENNENHTRYKGVRLVQTHNSILNIIVKTGILFSIIYFSILSRIVEKYNDKQNIEYIVPYLVNSIFMHSMLDSSFLIFWIFILSIPNKQNKELSNEDCKCYSS